MIAAAELEREWQRARERALQPPVRDWLLERGFTLPDLVAAQLLGGIGVAHVMPDGDGWQASVDPRDPKSKRLTRAAVIVPVWESVYCPAVAMRDADECDHPPALLDLLAFEPTAPARFWRRTGFADFLGAADLDFASGTLEVQPHPLAWLARSFVGVVPLTPGAWRDLAQRPDLRLQVETIDEGLAVQRALEAARRKLPEIVLPERRKEARAA